MLYLVQSSNLADEVVGLRNHMAELEDEKGNLQLRIVELEEALVTQGEGHPTLPRTHRASSFVLSMECFTLSVRFKSNFSQFKNFACLA